MITKAKQNQTTHEPVSIGTTIKQNIADKLPVINTQVKFSQQKTKKKFLFFS